EVHKVESAGAANPELCDQIAFAKCRYAGGGAAEGIECCGPAGVVEILPVERRTRTVETHGSTSARHDPVQPPRAVGAQAASGSLAIARLLRYAVGHRIARAKSACTFSTESGGAAPSANPTCDPL